MKIPFRGIVKNTPAGLAQDGELEDVLNLRYKDGAWRPIPDRSAIFSELPYTNVYIHSNSGYTHYLGVKNTKALEYFAQDIDGVPKFLQTPVVLATLTTDTAEFSQIGNVINIVDGGLKYLIWYDDAYVLIDSNFDGAQDSTSLIGRVDLKVDAETTLYNGELYQVYNAETEGLPEYSNLDAYKDGVDARRDLASAVYTRMLATNKTKGNLTGYLLCITAIELYDGTYIRHSSPVLLGMPWDIYSRYNRDGYSYLNNPNVLYYGFLPHGEYVKAKKAYSITSGGQQTYENLPSIQLQSFYNYDIRNNLSVLGFCAFNKLKYKIPQSINNQLKPLVKSISIFITTEIDLFDSKKDITHKGTSLSTDNYHENYYYPAKTNEEIIKELAELRTFYKVHEIPFEQIQASPDWIDIDLKDKLGDALLTQEALPYDDFSHHSTLPQVAMTYNSKLHVANYKTLLSRGWPMNYFYASNYYGIGQFQATEQEGEEDVQGWIEWVSVTIKTSNGVTTVVRINPELQGEYLQIKNLSAMLSYPDARATEITFYREYPANGGLYNIMEKKFPLKSFTGQNFAYYINPDLKPINFTTAITSDENKGILSESNREQIFQNAMKVSEVNNPFTFPVQNTYQVGNGSITGIASNTIALSTGQFGEFPLYVFTTDGIWAMYVGGAEVNYTSSRPVSREVCNNPKSIKAIDTGVVFSTAKGIMVIAGSTTKELSEPIEGAVFDIDKLSLFKKALNHDKLTTLLSEVTGEDIHDYIASANVGYNYIESEIWFTNPLKSYSYVFSKGLWYKVKQTGNRFIDDYPKQYLLTSTGDLVDIASEVLKSGFDEFEREASQQIMLLTRPLKFGDVEFKQMLTAIMRGQIITMNVIESTEEADIIHKKWAGIHVYGSYDGERWVFLGGAEKQGELNDIGTRIERTDCRYYRIALYGNVSINSYINYLEMEGKQSILRTKLR